MSVTRYPENKNFLSPLGFKFVLSRAPSLEYFVQTVNIPSISTTPANVPSPFVKMPFAGDHLEFGDLEISFKIDEDMKNYLEIYNWLMGIGFPDKFNQYKDLNTDPGIYSDAVLVVLTSSKNPNMRVKFKKMWPLSLDAVQFDTTQTDVEYISTTATFKYQSFEIEIVT